MPFCSFAYGSDGGGNRFDRSGSYWQGGLALSNSFLPVTGQPSTNRFEADALACAEGITRVQWRKMKQKACATMVAQLTTTGAFPIPQLKTTGGFPTTKSTKKIHRKESQKALIMTGK